MATYKTLIVAPKTDLEMVDDEVQQVINTLGSKVIKGSQATIHGLLNIITEPFDIIWFATHGDEKGVYLNDGVLTTSEITTMVRSTGAQLCVLNTCSSHPIALSIYDELKVDLVCTIKAIPDRTAFITATLFARFIAQGLSFREAFDKAKPGQDQTYRYYPERQEQMSPIERPNNRQDQGQFPDSDTLERFFESVKELDIVVNGSSRYGGVKGLKKIVETLEAQLKTIQEQYTMIKYDLEEIKKKQKVRNWIMWGMGTTIAILIITIAVLVLQPGVTT